MRSLLLAVVAALTLTVPTGGAQSPGLGEPIRCVAPSGFTCRYLTVPLDRSGARPGTLRLKVAAANNTGAPRGILLLLTGGPGQPGVPFAARLSTILSAVTKDYRLVLFDQRGTGDRALDCPELQAAMGSSDLTPPPARAVRACASRLGVNRRFYGTDDVVADMDALRQALGADRWALDGVSYGTFVAERYALAHPARVSKLVLDSVVPHSGRWDLGVDEMQAVARVLRLACADGGCPTDPTADLAAVVAKRHNGVQILDSLTLLSIVDPTYRVAFDVPSALHQARRGNLAALNGMLATTRNWSSTSARDLSQGLHASALCADFRFPWGDSATPAARREAALARAVKRTPARSFWPFDRATAAGNGFIRQCLPWAPTPPTPAPRAGAKITVPTLLVNGDRDLSTPLAWAKQEAALMTNGRLVVVSGAGHGVQTRARNPAGRNAVFEFLKR
jgi:pimeloyl-ACP methyl ester carboxylesterase